MSKQGLTSGQVARMLNIPARTIRSYLSTGRLRARQNPVTGRWTIEREDLSEFMRLNWLDPSQLSRPLRVLVVDQDAETSQLLRKALTRTGRTAAVEQESNCAAALIRTGTAPPDLLVLDADTAGEHCRELIEAIRSLPRTSGVRVLLIESPSRTQPDALPTHARLRRPFVPDQIPVAIDKALARLP